MQFEFNGIVNELLEYITEPTKFPKFWLPVVCIFDTKLLILGICEFTLSIVTWLFVM